MLNQEPAIIVKDLYKSFKLPHEQHSGIKQLLINVAKRKKGYEVQHVLKDVSFEIKKGEFFGIVGRNGSGKSTLLKLIAGIYVPDKGLIQVNGSITPFIELGVGFNPELTGRENVFMNGAMLGFSHKEMEGMYDGIVEFAEIEKFMDQKLKNYSSGMQVRLAFSIAIRAQGDILIIDEVLAVGDAAFQQKCFDYFEKLKKEKKTIIIVTHDMSAVKRFCTNAVYVKNGKVITYGTTSDVADVYLVDNIENSNEAPVDDRRLSSGNYTLNVKIRNEKETNIFFDFSYNSSDSSDKYIGMSILKDGISIAEITTLTTIKLKSEGMASFELDTSNLNSGVYEMTAVLCQTKTKRLLTIGANRVSFVVKGIDVNRGGALKLKDTWRQ